MAVFSSVPVTAGLAVIGAGLLAPAPPAVSLSAPPQEHRVQLAGASFSDFLTSHGPAEWTSADPGEAADYGSDVSYPDMDHIPNNARDILQAVVDLGQAQISAGLSGVSGGDLIAGLWEISSGLSNLFVAAPETAVLGMIDTALAQQIVFPYFAPNILVWSSLDFGGLINDIQQRSVAGMSAISDGIGALAFDDINVGLASIVVGLNHLLVEIPLDLILGPATVLLAGL